MEGKSVYSECELRYIDQGYDPARAAETCAEAKDRSSDEKGGESGPEEYGESYGDDF